MRITLILTIAISLFFASCEEEKKIVVPEDLIARDKFIELLSEVRLLEGAYATRYSRVDSSVTGIDSYYQRIFDNHGVTRAAFRRSYEFYANDQTQMLGIEELVITRITTLESTQDTLSADSSSQKLKVPQ